MHLVAKGNSLILALFLILGCAEVTFSPATSSVMALITAPIVIITIRYPGEEFQALELLGQS